MNEYGVLAEWHGWEERGSARRKISLSATVSITSHMDWPVFETRPTLWESRWWSREAWHNRKPTILNNLRQGILNEIREVLFYMLCIMCSYMVQKELDEDCQHATFLSMLLFKTVRNCVYVGFYCTHINTNSWQAGDLSLNSPCHTFVVIILPRKKKSFRYIKFPCLTVRKHIHNKIKKTCCVTQSAVESI